MSSHVSPAVSITILGTLRLLRIPRSSTTQCMHAILRMLLFRSHADPFFSFTLNDIELSIFAEGDFVDRVFGPLLQEHPALAEASDELWVALQVETHGDSDYENSGNRVRELAQPLAAEGISILYVSTYISDFILLKEHRLEQVIRILQRQSGFTFQQSAELDNLSDASSISSEEKVRAWANNSSHHESTTAISSPATSVGARSRAGSLYLHDTSLVDGNTRQSSPAGSQSGRVSRQPSLSRSTNLLASLTLTSPKPINESLPNLDNVPSEVEAQDQEPELDNVPRSFEDPVHTRATSALSHLDLGPKLCVLPDELVCVGLNPEYESSWREKLVQAFFYSDDVLPPAVNEDESIFMGTYSPSVDGSEMASSTDYLGRNSSAHPSSSQRRKPRTFADSKGEESTMERSPSTSDADHPTPFVSFTATLEGCSLTGDVRLLRKLFPNDESKMVFTAGEGGLDSAWIGEEGDSGDSDERGRRRRRESVDGEKMDESRRLLKCLQLNLASFGLDKHGIVNALTDILTTNGINLLYSSTFATANILVSKQDLSDARRILLGKI